MSAGGERSRGGAGGEKGFFLIIRIDLSHLCNRTLYIYIYIAILRVN